MTTDYAEVYDTKGTSYFKKLINCTSSALTTSLTTKKKTNHRLGKVSPNQAFDKGLATTMHGEL